jgi:hypothetical protein
MRKPTAIPSKKKLKTLLSVRSAAPKTLGLGSFLFLILSISAYAQGDHESLKAIARGAEPGAYRYAQDSGALLVPTADARSMLLWWQPEGFDPAKGITLVSLHDAQGWVTRDFQVWHEYLRDQGWAYLGLQWWDGRRERDHLQPHEIVDYLRWGLFRFRVAPGRAVLAVHPGSLDSQALVSLDKQDDDGPYFGAVSTGPADLIAVQRQLG